jgi:acylphosphatase
MMDRGVEVFFSGMVQGVGFRFTARSLAVKYKIRGWVANLPDGRVQLLAEGAQENLDSFLGDLKVRFDRQIVDLRLQEVEPCADYKNFQIKITI